MAPAASAPPLSAPPPVATPASLPAPAPALPGWVLPTGLVLALLAGGGAWTSWQTQQRVHSLEMELVKRQQDSGEQSAEARVLARQSDEIARDAAAKVALMEARVSEVALQRGQIDDLLQSLSRSRDENAVSDIDSAVRLAIQQSTLTGSAERLAESMDQGRAFAATIAALTGIEMPARPLPVAVGVAARSLDLPAEEIIAHYLHGFAANLISAATRFLPLGQAQAQAALAGLHPLIAQTANRAAIADREALETGCFGADLAAMRHETLDVRIFRT